MPQNDGANPLKPLKVVLVIYAIVSLVYGLGFLFTPGMLVSMAGGEPVDFAWLRWPGGVLIALGIGALLVFRMQRPEPISQSLIRDRSCEHRY